MSGHNKWSTIKRKKGAIDAKRSKIFSKINKEITVAVKESGPDPDSNPRLRLAIANAKGASMPKDNIQRAISKGSDKDGASFIECTFEGYANGGTAIFLEATTDNQQRTIAFCVGAHGVRFDGPAICVPQRDENNVLWSFQRIAADGEFRFLDGTLEQRARRLDTRGFCEVGKGRKVGTVESDRERPPRRLSPP